MKKRDHSPRKAQKRPYRARLFKRRVKQVPYKTTQKKHLRTDPAIISLEPTYYEIARSERGSFLDVSDLLEEEIKTLAQTKIREESGEITAEIQQLEEAELQVNEEASLPDTPQRNQKI